MTPSGATALARRKVPRRYARAFSPEVPVPPDVQYIPYTHAVAQAHRRRRRGPLAGIGLAAVWTVVVAYELVGGAARQPVLLGLTVVSFVAFAGWNATRLVLLQRGDPSGAVWRYGLFLFPEALVVLPATGPVVIVGSDHIDAVEPRRERPAGPEERGATASSANDRVVVVRAKADDGAPVNVIIEDLGAMPAPHLVRTIDAWRREPRPVPVTPSRADRSPRRG